MRIIYYSSNPTLDLASQTGYGTHMREVIAAFEALGHEVIPVIMADENLPGDDKPKDPSLRKKLAKSVTPSIVWESVKDYLLLKRDKQCREELETKIEELKPDLVYERASYLQNSGVEAAATHGVRHILEINAPYIEEREHLQGSSAFLNKAESMEEEQLKSTSQIVVVSTALKNYYIDKYGIPSGKFTVTPNAINPDHTQVSNQSIETLREEYGLADKKVLGFVGSIFGYHGVDMLLKVFCNMAAAHEDLVLLIVGSGSSIDELKEMCEDDSARERIIFTGKLPNEEVFPHISLMDIAIQPNSRWYMSPIKLFEYGAMGRAVVAPDTEAVRDLIEPNVNGVLIDPAEETLQQAIENLLGNEQQRERLGTALREKILNHFTWHQVATRILDMNLAK